MKRNIRIILAVCLTAVLAGCQGAKKIPVSGEQTPGTILSPLHNTEGEQIGEVTLIEDENGVKIHVAAKGLTPGTHGIHIHEKGVCTPPDFKSAGGHFNPTDKEHGFDNPKGFHLGDLPNIEVNEEGETAETVTTSEVTLKAGQANSIIGGNGSAIVIHEQADDYETDPAGDSGDRVACAVISGPVKK